MVATTKKVCRALTATLGAAGCCLTAGCRAPAVESTPATATGAVTAPTKAVAAPDPFIAAKAKECGGDFSKLSPEDRKKLDEMTHGHGEQAIRSLGGAPARR